MQPAYRKIFVVLFIPAAFAALFSLGSLCEAPQCAHWGVRSEAELSWQREALTEGETALLRFRRGGALPLPRLSQRVPVNVS